MSRWETLTFDSHYRAALEIKAVLEAGQVTEAQTGLDYLIAAMGRSEKRALKSQLIRLMLQVCKWKEQPSHRSRSWLQTILQARQEIGDIQDEVPSLTQSVIMALWDECIRRAKSYAAVEMGHSVQLATLTWAEVFDAVYTLEDLEEPKE